MSGCEHSIWKILSAGAAMFLMVPSLALGEFGVCPPYSKTFGPGDLPEDVVSFINSASERPGGGTVRLRPGDYALGGLVPVSGVLCIRGLPEEGGPPVKVVASSLTVLPGGILTLLEAEYPPVWVQDGAHLFAADVELTITVDHGGFARIDESMLHPPAENFGTLLVSNSQFTGGSGDTVISNFGGYLYLDQVAIHGNSGGGYGGWPTALGNGPDHYEGRRGVAILRGITITGNWGYKGCSGIENDGYMEITGSVVANGACGPNGGISCDNWGEFIDLGYNVLRDDASCPLTEPTSIYTSLPIFIPGSIELTDESPAIDRVPLEFCRTTDLFGRARTDGNGDGIIACDSGALEYGHYIVDVKDWVSFQPDPSTYNFTRDTNGCPGDFVGKFGFEAQLANISQFTLHNVRIRVTELSNGNLVLNEEDGYCFGEGRIFPLAEADDYLDGYLAPSEYVDVPFTICLKSRRRFRFFVDVLGVPVTDGG